MEHVSYSPGIPHEAGFKVYFPTASFLDPLADVSAFREPYGGNEHRLNDNPDSDQIKKIFKRRPTTSKTTKDNEPDVIYDNGLQPTQDYTPQEGLEEALPPAEERPGFFNKPDNNYTWH